MMNREKTMHSKTIQPHFLKECMADALLQLMKKKRFETITVTEIINAANVGRSTYYRNFNSKEDVLVYKVDIMLEQWVQREQSIQYDTEKDIFVSLFYYLQTIQDELDTIVKSRMESTLLTANYRVFETEEYPSASQKYNACYHSMGLSGVILSWIKKGMKESPEEMGTILSYTIFREYI